MAGLAPDAEHFFKFLFILVLYTLAMTLFVRLYPFPLLQCFLLTPFLTEFPPWNSIP